MNKLQRSWLLFKRSLSVMNHNRQLVVFPVVVFLFTTLIVLFFLAPAVLMPTGHPYTSSEHWAAVGNNLLGVTHDAQGKPAKASLSPLAVGYLAVVYLVSMFCATYFNVAFYHEILEALCNRPVSIGRGLKFALTKWKAILLWTLFAGLVGLIIRQIEQRAGIVGSIIGRFIGVAWSVASVFAIPLIIYQPDVNPVTILKNSAGVLKRTWGEALIGYLGIGTVTGLVSLIFIIPLGGAVAASIALNNYWLIAIVGPICLLALFIWSYLTSVAGNVYKGALYLYAAYNYVPEAYDQDLLNSAWKFKKTKGV